METKATALHLPPCLHISGWAFGNRIGQHLEIVAQPQPLGGERFYVPCPTTCNRCTSLIMPPTGRMFASVKAWGIAYTSQREDSIDRCLRRISKLEDHMALFAKYTRQRTREACNRTWIQEQMLWDDAAQELYASIAS